MVTRGANTSVSTTTPRDKLIASLQDRAFREAYVAEHLHQGFSFQVRATRDGRNLSQKQLGDLADMKQSRISQIEDPSNEGLTLKTAQRIARALDVALILRLVPYSKFVDFITVSTSLSMNDWMVPIPAFGDDHPMVGLREDSISNLMIRGAFDGTAMPYQAAFRLAPDSKIIDMQQVRSSTGPAGQMTG